MVDRAAGQRDPRTLDGVTAAGGMAEYKRPRRGIRNRGERGWATERVDHRKWNLLQDARRGRHSFIAAINRLRHRT